MFASNRWSIDTPLVWLPRRQVILTLYRWSPVPQERQGAEQYIDTALAWQAAGSAVPFAIVRLADDRVIGSTRFWNIEGWAWPEGHPSHGRTTPDACEIGYTWYAPSAIRTAANTESKFLMLRHAFESWQVLRVCFHTDLRNERSRAALARIGGRFYSARSCPVLDPCLRVANGEATSAGPAGALNCGGCKELCDLEHLFAIEP
jgi:RimJ/RimL family protein N-acetyltransferase